ncbi:MAG: NACHT domain-containing protein [Limnoraphis robusta]
MSIVNNVAKIRVIATPGTAMTSNPQQFEEEFSEAYEKFEIERLLSDLTQATHIQEKKKKKDFSPASKAGLLGRLCGFSRDKIARKSRCENETIRQALSREIYPALTEILNLEENIDWQEQNVVAELLHEYRKKPRNSSAASSDIQTKCREVCAKMLEKQQQNQQIRRKATQMGFETQVYVPLGLVERKQQNIREDIPIKPINFRENEVIERIYKHDEFLSEIIGKNQNKRLAIVGESGSGKTTWVDQIATYIKSDETEDLYIFISLGSLQKKTLEEYILEKWLPNATAYADLDIDSETLEKPLQKRFRQGGVWLLLDGVDEIGETSISQKLENIREQLTGWLSEARVILTCRTNDWDTYLNNPLSGFETYKTQEFKPEDVDQFIQDWFTQDKKEQRGQALQDKLKEPQHEHVSQLVTNPLRLALLCQIFSKNPNAELPETKAGLYKQFIGYFYEWKPTKIGIDLVKKPTLQHELHQVLGRLAIAGLDSSDRFRLPESLVRKEINNDELFNLALELDWLVLIDRDNQTDKPIYQFFHPSFQEYFAALAVPNWEFLFNHVPGEISENSSYKIFESDRQEIALMWIDSMESENFSKFKIEFTKVIDSIFLMFSDYSQEDYLRFYSIKILPFVISVGLKFCNYSELESFYDYCQAIYQLILILITNDYWDKEKQQYKLFPSCYHSLILSSIKKLPDDLLYSCIKEVDKYLKKYNDYSNYQFKILNLMLDIPSQRDFAAEKMLNFLHLNDEVAIDAAFTIFVKYDKSHPLAIHKLIDLFLITYDPEKCDLIFHCLLESSLNSEFINDKVIFKLTEFLKSENYDARQISIDFLLELIDREAINIIDDNHKLFTLLTNTIIQKNKIKMYKIIDLLEKLGSKKKAYYKKFIDLISPEQDIATIDILLERLENKDLDFVDYVNIINQLIWVSEVKYYNNDRKNSDTILIIVSELVLNNEVFRKALEFLMANSNEEYIVEATKFILKLMKDDEVNSIEISSSETKNKCNQRVEKKEYEKFKRLFNNKKAITLEDWDNNAYTALALIAENTINIDEKIDIINQIIDVIELRIDSNLRRCCISALDYIGALSNPDIIQKLINIIKVTTDKSTYLYFTTILKEITHLEILNILVANFKDYTADQVRDDDLWLYMAAHEIVWHCAQHMSYPEFYHAWNSPALITSSETLKSLPASITQDLNFSELPTTLKNAIANDIQLNQAIHLVCVDGTNFSDPDNPAMDIYIEMIEQNCPERKQGTPETLSHLKTYWRLDLKKSDQKVVLLFYTSKPDHLFSENFLTVLTTFGSAIALISDQTCEDIQCFSPNDTNLIENILKWLK